MIIIKDTNWMVKRTNKIKKDLIEIRVSKINKAELCRASFLELKTLAIISVKGMTEKEAWKCLKAENV